jgi:hypothetical protein
VKYRSTIDRRAFVGQLAAGATATSGAAAAAEENPASQAADLAAAKPVELWLALVKQLDCQRLSDEDLQQLRAEIEVNLLRSSLLSRFGLTNADEPAPVFRAWRAEE